MTDSTARYQDEYKSDFKFIDWEYSGFYPKFFESLFYARFARSLYVGVPVMTSVREENVYLDCPTAARPCGGVDSYPYSGPAATEDWARSSVLSSSAT